MGRDWSRFWGGRLVLGAFGTKVLRWVALESPVLWTIVGLVCLQANELESEMGLECKAPKRFGDVGGSTPAQ